MSILQTTQAQVKKRTLVTIQERYALTKEGSSKQTYHIVLSTKGQELAFAVGDSIAIYAQNSPLLVQRFLDSLNAQGSELIISPRTKELVTLRDFLTTKANLAKPPAVFPNSLQETCEKFLPLLPRFYSIASSPHVHPDEIHLTVVLTTFEHAGEKHFGVASYFLSHLAEIGKTPIPIYVQKARAFSLPDPSTPMIMIGPGTGIAPFRAFVQERIALNHPGKNWLFFGERNRTTDYFYEDLWQALVQQKKLRLDLAFSRDQEEKIYVQHRLLENAPELWAWIQEGASIYVCGDASRMAKDVEATLQKIACEQGNMSLEDARAFIKNLRAQKRYQLDVY